MLKMKQRVLIRKGHELIDISTICIDIGHYCNFVKGRALIRASNGI